VLDQLDIVLLMSVNPGYGGQSFIEHVLPKIEAVRRRIDATGRDIWLEVDGGIKADNAQRVGNAGADTLVAGSAVFSGGHYRQAIETLRSNALAGKRLRAAPGAHGA
jgi:ribulose-phosphate 3-epimerase